MANYIHILFFIQVQYKFLYEFVRNLISGRYTEQAEQSQQSDHMERLSSAEVVADDFEPKKMVSRFF